MDKAQVIDWLKANGYTEDRFGHYQKTCANGKKYRVKLQAQTVRKELQVRMPDGTYSKGENEWVRIWSQPYKKLAVATNGKLLVG